MEREFLPLYPDLGLTVYAPLAAGTLTGKYVPGEQAQPGTRAAAMKVAPNRRGVEVARKI